MKSLNKKRVFLIGPTESILTKRGNRFPNIAQYLFDQGEHVIYYTANFYHAEKRFFSAGEISAAKENLKYELRVLKSIGYFNNVSARRVINNFLFSFMIFLKLLIRSKKEDCVFLPSRPVELIFFMALLKRIKGVKIVLDIQDIWPDALEISNKRKKRIFERYCNLFLRPSLKYYNHTIHTAPSFKNWLYRYAKSTPSVFVPLGWENERWNGFRKEKEDFTNAKIKLVCVAQLQHQIDVMPILEVLKDNDRYHLTIIGEDGKGERYPEVKKYIDEHALANVEIIGKVNREDMKFYLESKDIGVLPMITPSIPNKIFDYLACELPIVVLGANDSSEFVLQNAIGWSCDYDSDQLSEVLKTIDKNELELKINQVKNIREKYSRNQLHKEIKKILI